MNLNVVAPCVEHVVNVDLLGPGVVADALELDKKRAATWDQEDPVGPPSLAQRCELQAFDAKIIQSLPNNLGLNVSFKMPHGAA